MVVASGAAGACSPDGSASDEVHKVYIVLVENVALLIKQTYKVVAEKLHDEGRVLIALFGEGVELWAQVLVYAGTREILKVSWSYQQWPRRMMSWPSGKP